MRRLRVEILPMFMVFLLAGCAAVAPPGERKIIVATPAVTPPVAEKRPEPLRFPDRDLFFNGISALSGSNGTDPARARLVFASLIQSYPNSEWRTAAETLIRLIDEEQSLLEARRRDRALIDQTMGEKARLLQESDQLKKRVRELTERFEAEKAALSRENEQLKKDLSQLKALEIELEKRDRMLR
jgi:hypothetical protein